ncbi:SGNH hydrolase-type esterase domain-containing protein, partial [Tanacetum coccineum]
DPITGCLVSLNEFVEYHNDMLQKKLNLIRELHPNVNLIYADYYNAALQFYRSPNAFGFTSGALKACCGAGGPFNYNLTVRCGHESATMCDQPNTYANWDGVHLTETAYKLLFESLFQGPYTTPQFNSLCLTSASQVGVGLLSSM